MNMVNTMTILLFKAMGRTEHSAKLCIKQLSAALKALKNEMNMVMSMFQEQKAKLENSDMSADQLSDLYNNLAEIMKRLGNQAKELEKLASILEARRDNDDVAIYNPLDD